MNILPDNLRYLPFRSTYSTNSNDREATGAPSRRFLPPMRNRTCNQIGHLTRLIRHTSHSRSHMHNIIINKDIPRLNILTTRNRTISKCHSYPINCTTHTPHRTTSLPSKMCRTRSNNQRNSRLLTCFRTPSKSHYHPTLVLQNQHLQFLLTLKENICSQQSLHLWYSKLSRKSIITCQR